MRRSSPPMASPTNSQLTTHDRFSGTHTLTADSGQHDGPTRTPLVPGFQQLGDRLGAGAAVAASDGLGDEAALNLLGLGPGSWRYRPSGAGGAVRSDCEACRSAVASCDDLFAVHLARRK